MEKQINACIFDLDGVIVDTAKYHYMAWEKMAKELGFNFSTEQNEQLKGVSRMDSLNLLLQIGNKTLSQEQKYFYANKKNEWYLNFIQKMNPNEILPGSIELFQELKDSGIKIALGSASKNALTILNKINITKWFDAVIDGTKISNSKPNPEVFLLGAESLKIQPANCVVFEDAVVGVEAAINAGMYCVGIGNKNILTKANFVVNGLHEISVEKLNSLF